jgi:hypothetical protein
LNAEIHEHVDTHRYRGDIFRKKSELGIKVHSVF